MTSKRLPGRWHPLRHHPEQERLWRENKRFAVVPAGRRSGKTELAKRRLALALLEKKAWTDPRYFAAAPTRDQAKRIYWKDLKALVPKRLIRRVYEGDLCITTRLNSELWVVGLDRPERVEGTPWDGGVLDEYANMREGAWEENLRPALSDRMGWCWFVGVPEGANHYKDLYEYARSGLDPDWGAYTWRSADILPQVEIAAARRVLDERTFRQEYEAAFEDAAGRVYYPYRAEIHEDLSIEARKDLPLIVCCDFNVEPCVWELAQTDGKTVWVVDEIVLRNTGTLEMGKELLSRHGGHKAGLILYGDAAGKSRSTAGKSDYAILYDLGLKDQRVRGSNPAVRDRVNAVNSMLLSKDGLARLTHHPRCAALRRDFEAVVWKGGESEIEKADRERTHASDAIGYFIEARFPLRIERREPGLKFYK